MSAARHELILGGAKSGKSRLAESRASDWLAANIEHQAILVATALPASVTGDDEMGQRIARHQADRACRVPQLRTVEAPFRLGNTLQALSDRRHLLVVDCLTLWLTQCLMPPPVGAGADGLGPVPAAPDWRAEHDALLQALERSASPVVLVSNEIGLGVMPMSREARAFVDALGLLHQSVAELCARVTLMAAGCALTLKDLR